MKHDSDFQKLTFKVLKEYHPKQKPKVVFYQKYKNFRNDLCRYKLENELSNYEMDVVYEIFLKNIPWDLRQTCSSEKEVSERKPCHFDYQESKESNYD